MYRSGIILAIISLVVAIGATLLSPLCTPCASLFLGVAAGFLAGVFDSPQDNNASAKAGAIAGAIGGIGAMLGQFVGAGVNGALMGPEQTAQLLEQFGLNVAGQTDIASTYWISLVGGAVCFGLLDVALMAGLGAVGGLLWWQITGKNKNKSVAV